MSQSRLTSVLDDGLVTLSDDALTVLRPALDFDLSAVPGAKVLTTFKPDADGWQARGYTSTDAIGPVALVVLPRSKSHARSMIAQAAGKAGLILVDGQKTDGVDSIFKECRKVLGDLPSITKAHGRLFWFEGTDKLADWLAPPPAQGPDGFYTQAGVFSEGQVDRGSALLAAALPHKLPSRMADFGAGWGFLSRAVLEREAVLSVDLYEAERLALDCARMNITDPRASFHWADVTTLKADTAYGGIVMNPPFHTGRATDPALGRAFIDAAARSLSTSGQLWMVANRHLPYEQALKDRFKSVEEIGSDPAFKLFCASRPKR